MKKPLALSIALTALLACNLGHAQTLNSDSDHVTIVIAQNGNTDKKVKSPAKHGKKAKKKKAHKKASAKSTTAPVATHTVLAQNKMDGRTQNIVINVIPPAKQTAPGQRVTLANSPYAHANGATPSNTLDDGPVTSVPIRSSNNTLSESLKTVHKEAEQTNPWGLMLRSYNAANLNALENAPIKNKTDGEVQDWDRLDLTYNFNSDVSFGVEPNFFHTWFGDRDRSQSGSVAPGTYNQNYSAYFGDTALILSDAKLAQFGNHGSDKGYIIDAHLHYWLPTGEVSQTSGQIGEVRVGAGISKSVGKWDFKWTEEVRYDIQQYETSSIVDTDGHPLPNQNYILLHYADIGYNLSSAWAFTFEAGFWNQAKYGDSFNGGNSQLYDYIILDPEVDFTVNKHFSLALGLWEQYDMRSQPTVNGAPVQTYTPFAFYNGTSAYLQATVKF